MPRHRRHTGGDYDRSLRSGPRGPRPPDWRASLGLAERIGSPVSTVYAAAKRLGYTDILRVRPQYAPITMTPEEAQRLIDQGMTAREVAWEAGAEYKRFAAHMMAKGVRLMPPHTRKEQTTLDAIRVHALRLADISYDGIAGLLGLTPRRVAYLVSSYTPDGRSAKRAKGLSSDAQGDRIGQP